MELSRVATSAVSGERRRVAIIEDDPFWQYQLRFNLKAIDANFDIRVLASAEEFLIQDDGNFDLIISDQNLGAGRSGMSVWRQLHDQKSEIPFILTSGTNDNFFESLAIDGLPKPLFIEKPYRFQNFKMQVESLFALRATAAIGQPLTKELNWSLLFNSMVFLSAVAATAVAVASLQVEKNATGGPQIGAPPAIVQKTMDLHKTYVNAETYKRMNAILARAENINHLKLK